MEFSFANTINTIDGGAHLTGFRAALTRVLNDYARKQKFLKDDDANLSGDDVREGLVAVISVKLPEPQFEGQTKTRLGNAEVKTHVESGGRRRADAVPRGAPVRRAPDHREGHHGGARARGGAQGARPRRAQGAARRHDAARQAGGLLRARPGRSASCTSSRETAPAARRRRGRDRRFQAILPLRGKILNVEKARMEKMLAHEEIRALITALGTGFGETMDLGKLRYHRIIIMTDADVDGSHIRTLLLTFFFRYMRDADR